LNEADPIIAIDGLTITADWAAALIALILGLVSLIFSVIADRRSRQAMIRADTAIKLEVLKADLEILYEYRETMAEVIDRRNNILNDFAIIDGDQEEFHYRFSFKKNSDPKFDEAIVLHEELLTRIRSFDILESAQNIISDDASIFAFSDPGVWARHYRGQREKSSYSQGDTAKYIADCLIRPWKVFFYDIKNEIDRRIATDRSEILSLRAKI
jgi:hypothetical protein